MCFLNFFFDSVHLLIRLHQLKASFFDTSLSLGENIASLAILMATVTAGLGAGVVYAIWRDFRRNIQSEDSPLYPQAGGFMAPPGPAGSRIDYTAQSLTGAHG